MKIGFKTLITITCSMFLFLGIIIGFIMAPIKNGIYCGNNNCSRYNDNDELWDEDWDEDDWRVSENSTDDIPF